MARREFTKATQRQAKSRSGDRCEAVGPWYGWKPGQRCNADLAYGVEYDHIDLDANSKDNSLSNCAAVCIRCHAVKTRTHDIPVAAKTLRQQDRANGVRRRSGKPMPGSKASGLKKRMDGTVVYRNARSRSAFVRAPHNPAIGDDHE